MKTALTLLLILSLAAEAVVWLQMHRMIKGFGEEHLEDPLSNEEVRFIEKRATLLQVLSAVNCVLLLVRVVVYDILPLIRG